MKQKIKWNTLNLTPALQENSWVCWQSWRHTNFDRGSQSKPHSMRNKHGIFVIAPFQVLSLIAHNVKFCCLNNNYQDKFSKENTTTSEKVFLFTRTSVCFSYTSKRNTQLIGWLFKILVSNTRLCSFSSFFFFPCIKQWAEISSLIV